jgi:hypothetical protein
MDHGWIVTRADPQRPDAQLTVITHDPTTPVVPVTSTQVDDGDESYRAARAAEAKVVHERTEEPWKYDASSDYIVFHPARRWPEREPSPDGRRYWLLAAEPRGLNPTHLSAG